MAYVYRFSQGKADGDGGMKATLGGKGAGLAEMSRLGIPVPPGFTISTEACLYYSSHQEAFPPGLKEEVMDALKFLEDALGKGFGNADHPLLVSVRSGAPISMPGMMDTILNLGLNDETLRGLIQSSQNPRFSWDCYRRFIQMFGNVVMGVEHDLFEAILDEEKRKHGVELDTGLTAENLQGVVKRYLALIQKETGKPFPQDPLEQLWMAIGAVFRSWNNKRAREYRRLHHIPDTLGTAVNVQAMVFGNRGEDSATGVAFTRNPSTGEKVFYGEFLVNAQGEDVVAGIRTPRPIEELKKLMPSAYEELLSIRERLEARYKDMQDVEFTIEAGKLYMLQTRSGKRTGQAAIKIAVDMVDEGLITPDEALCQFNPDLLSHLLAPVLKPEDKKKAKKLGVGLNAGPGAASGQIVFFAEDAVKAAETGKEVILVRTETSPEDVAGMFSAKGILTSRGGMTSHAAVVARGMGKPCVVGMGSLEVDEKARRIKVHGEALKEGDWITIDGTTGEVFQGALKPYPSEILQVLFTKTLKPEDSPIYGYFKRFMEWATQRRQLKIRTNADTPQDAHHARVLGAEGIGLCRTEHMFFAEDRIQAVREMILADRQEEREKALKKIEPMQQGDFEGIFETMEGLPVTIRLLDPPLHEFLPKEPKTVKKVAQEMGISKEKLEKKVEALEEMNPMLGHRGCRLGITLPEIYAMQVRAILKAALKLKAKGKQVFPEIMIPLVGIQEEFTQMKRLVDETAKKVFQEMGDQVAYTVGTMIEVPRACLVADQIATNAEFFSFGTNDLTQMTFGFSRDDINKFLPFYLNKGILPFDPFASLDQEGVGQLVALGVERGRKTKKDLKVGVCGEHGGDPASIRFFHKVGLDYVSCSPFRVPIALVAAAQAQILQG